MSLRPQAATPGMLEHMGRFLLTVVAFFAGLFVVGAVAVWLLKAVLGAMVYLIVGAAIVAAVGLAFSRARRSVGSQRNRNRISAATQTWRQRH